MTPFLQSLFVITKERNTFKDWISKFATFKVAPNVMNIHAQEMSKSVRLKKSSRQILLHHVVNVALEKSTWKEQKGH